MKKKREREKTKGPRFESKKNTLKENGMEGKPSKVSTKDCGAKSEASGWWKELGFHLCLSEVLPNVLHNTSPFPLSIPHSHSSASNLISCRQAAVPLTLAVGLGGAPLALTTDAPGAAHQMEVGVTSEIHPGSIQSREIPTRQENLPIFQGQIRLGADSDCRETGK